MSNNKIRVLLEMRPALEGFAGIPQEVRLLFRGLKKIESVNVEGMLQTSHKILAKGTPSKNRWFSVSLSQSRKINRFSRVIISMAEKPYQTLFDQIYAFFEKRLYSTAITLETLLYGYTVKLTRFESKNFEDFVWRTLFSKTLPASDYGLVTESNFRVNSVPWNTMHTVGLNTLSLRSSPKYPNLELDDIDVFIGQTPYPARIRGSRVVIRYHDAIPVFMPHTISDKSLHQATHYYALMNNVKQGAWFSCVSESTRADLIKIFPQAEARSVTIYNMVSHHYFDEPSEFDRVREIVRTRNYGNDPNAKDLGLMPNFLTLREQESFYSKHISSNVDFRYLLIVSTVEPRKNHQRLLAAWEVVKSELDKNLKLVVVGTLGWDYKTILKGLKTWIDRGDLFMLNSVPAPDLRVLYKHSQATVCPSLGEGFDFSGVEAMASGGVTIASDIPVHREVYDDAAVYFDPYSTVSLVKAIKEVLYDDGADFVRRRMVSRGEQVAQRYQPEVIIPKWEEFLNRVVEDKSRGQ